MFNEYLDPSLLVSLLDHNNLTAPCGHPKQKHRIQGRFHTASWSTVLTNPVLDDGTDITTFNFTKGTDNWNPLPDLIANDNQEAITLHQPESSVDVYAYRNRIHISNVKPGTMINIYSINGMLVKSFVTNKDVDFIMNKGIWIVKVNALW